MQIFPENLRNLWNEWDIRAIILLSLCLQVILIPLGYRRKINSKNWLRVSLWFAYLSADWIATVSLGVLSNSQGNSQSSSLKPGYVIVAFWAPFLLLHLGGPDTITAYSMQDSDLWLRHLLGLAVQSGVAIYVFVRSLQPTKLNYIAIPIFVAGIVKYGERTWVLRSASSQHLRESLLPNPNQDPTRGKYLQEFIRAEKFYFGSLIGRKSVAPSTSENSSQQHFYYLNNSTYLLIAYGFFQINKRVFADLILSFQDLKRSLSFFHTFHWDEAFKVIELELGFMHDFFYTKAIVIHSSWGPMLRLITFLSTIVALGFFVSIDKHEYSLVDVSITYVLFCGATGLEIYSILLLLTSDWTKLHLSEKGGCLYYLTYALESRFASKKKWCNSIPQYNLMNSCFEDQVSKRYTFFKQILASDPCQTYQSVSPELKQQIFEHLLEKAKGDSSLLEIRKLSASRGDWTLKKYNCNFSLGWSVELEFDQSILLWHLATELCYFSDLKNAAQNSSIDTKCAVSKLLSGFLMHILVNRHSLFPNGLGQIRFLDTRADAIEFIGQRASILNPNDAYERLLEIDMRILPSELRGERSKSLLYHACRLTKALQILEEREGWGRGRQWEMMCSVWVEMVCNISKQCRWYEHAEQLGHGGDFLTHIWLLMLHLGFTEQFHIPEDHSRAELGSALSSFAWEMNHENGVPLEDLSSSPSLVTRGTE